MTGDLWYCTACRTVVFGPDGVPPDRSCPACGAEDGAETDYGVWSRVNT